MNDEEKYIQAAERKYGSDDIEIEGNVNVSLADNGAWVQAWVWVYNDEIETDEN